MRNQSNSALSKEYSMWIFLDEKSTRSTCPRETPLWFRDMRAGHRGLRFAHKAMLTGLRRSRGFYGVVESGAARLSSTRTSVDLLKEKAGGVLGAVMAKKSARCTSSR